MRFLMRDSLIRFCFLTVFALALLSGSVLAQKKRLFLLPGDTVNKDKKEEKSGSFMSKRRLFVAPGKKTKSRVPIFDKESRVSGGAAFREVRQDLGIYREALKIDPIKLTMAGGEPRTAEELRLVAAAHRLSKVQTLLEMQKDEKERQKRRALQKIRVSVKPAQFGFNGGAEKANNNSGKRVIYNKPKKSIFPWRIFGKQ